MNKTKILIVAPKNNQTIGLCSLNLYEAFYSQNNIEVKCVVVHKFKNGYPGFDECESCVKSKSSMFNKPFSFIKQLFWLKRIKQTFRPDITISTLGRCSTLNILSGGNERKIGIFHSPHTQEKDKGLIIYLYTLFEYHYVFPKLDKLACVSIGVKNHILESFKEYKNKKVDVIYNIHNVDDIKTKAQENLSDKEKSLVNSNSIIYVGRLDNNKAPMRALHAFYEAIENIPENANLIFIGKDTDNILPSLQEFIRDKNLSSRVYFLGFQKNPYKYLSHAKCLISTSYSEGLPGVMIESLYLGKPVISTNSSGGVWEILSCYDAFQPNIEDIYISEDGIITSNLAATNKLKYNIDIRNLAKAIHSVYKMKPVTFKFKEQIDSNIIIHKFLQ